MPCADQLWKKRKKKKKKKRKKENGKGKKGKNTKKRKKLRKLRKRKNKNKNKKKGGREEGKGKEERKKNKKRSTSLVMSVFKSALVAMLGRVPDADDPPCETEGWGVRSCSPSIAVFFFLALAASLLATPWRCCGSERPSTRNGSGERRYSQPGLLNLEH